MFADLGRVGSEEPSPVLLETMDGEVSILARAHSSDAATESRVPCRNRLQRHGRALDEYFAELASAGEAGPDE